MKYPDDIEEAAENFGANCGPCAIAAILDRSLAETRSLLDGFETRQYMNITHVQSALKAAGIAFQGRLKTRPTYGLAFIQWGGHEHKHHRAQYQFTHWIAVAGETVFDVNLPTLVHWKFWCDSMPAIIKEEGWGDGTFFIRSAIEVLTGEAIEP